MSTVIGIDVGGTTTRALLTDGNESSVLSTSTALGDGRSLTGGIADLVVSLIERAHVDIEEIAAIGVGVPGQADPQTGTVRHAVNLGIGDEPLALGAELQSRFGTRVAIENDVRVAALGAYHQFRSRDETLADLVYLGVGTGVAAGIVIGGRLHRGRFGLAGEIGHIAVDPFGPRCRCGLTGCLESVAAGPAIARRWSAGASDMFRAAGEGDAVAGAIATEVAAHLAVAMLRLSGAFDPDLIIVGGGVTSSWEDFDRFLREAISDLADRSAFSRELLLARRIVTLAPDLEVGTLGAAHLAWGAWEEDSSEAMEQIQGERI